MQSPKLLRSILGLAISTSLFAQSPRTSSGTLNNGSATTGTNTIPNNTTPFPDYQQPVYLSGKVMLDDGTPPPTSVVLRLACTSSPRAVGYTDRKGRFNVDLTDRNNVASITDVSGDNQGFPMPGGRTNTGGPRDFPQGISSQQRNSLSRSLVGCELLADLAGYRSDRISLSSRHALDNPEVGTIILHRLANVEGLTISATTALAPKDAKKAFDKGQSDVQKNKWTDAQKEFEKAVAVYPKFAEAWFQLGRSQEQSNNLEAAEKSYQQALVSDAKLAPPYERLAALAIDAKSWQVAADQSEHLVKLNPVDFPMGWFYNAVANLQLQKLDAAEKSARTGLELDTSHHIPQLTHLLGVILAQKHDYAGAAENMRAYLKLAPNAPDADMVRKQVDEVQRLSQPEPAK